MSDHQSSAGYNPPSIVLNPDGSYTRNTIFPCSPPTPDQDSDSPVLSKDVPLNPINKTWLRIYLPKIPQITQKLPLVVYIHGGGFVFVSAAATLVHDFCNQMAARLVAVVVSVEYRLAPEHRLPAAYEDAVDALHWIKSTQDRWLTDFADFSNCYLMGSSAGANIAYNAGLRAAVQVDDLKPLNINGLILNHLFFSGVERSGSEIRLADSARILTLSGCDDLWALALPVGANRDHEYCNPMMGNEVGRIRDVGWRVMVTGCYGDLLIDRQMEFGKMLKEKGVENVSSFEEGYHGIEMYDKSKSDELFKMITSFIYTCRIKQI